MILFSNASKAGTWEQNDGVCVYMCVSVSKKHKKKQGTNSSVYVKRYIEVYLELFATDGALIFAFDATVCSCFRGACLWGCAVVEALGEAELVSLCGFRSAGALLGRVGGVWSGDGDGDGARGQGGKGGDEPAAAQLARGGRGHE
jgi:hypothetical protein